MSSGHKTRTHAKIKNMKMKSFKICRTISPSSSENPTAAPYTAHSSRLSHKLDRVHEVRDPAAVSPSPERPRSSKIMCRDLPPPLRLPPTLIPSTESTPIRSNCDPERSRQACPLVPLLSGREEVGEMDFWGPHVIPPSPVTSRREEGSVGSDASIAALGALLRRHSEDFLSRRKLGSPSRSGSSVAESSSATTLDSFSSSVLDDLPLRANVVLLDPTQRKFEVVQVPFRSDETVGTLLRSIRRVRSVDRGLRKHRYKGFCRPSDGVELINMTRAKQSGIENGELLVAIHKDMNAEQCAAVANALLKNHKFNIVLNRCDPAAHELSRRERLLQQIDSLRSFLGKIMPAFDRHRELQSLPRSERRRRSRTVRLCVTSSLDADQPTPTTLALDTIIIIIDLWVFLRHAFVTARPSCRRFLLAACVLAATCYHRASMAPLGPATAMSFPGLRYRTRCGLKTLFPASYTGCRNAYLEVERVGDGSAALSVRDRGSYLSSLWPVWRSEKILFSNLNKFCWIKEIRVLPDGTVTYCGMKVQAKIPDEIMDNFVTPWPFPLEPPGWRQ